MEATKVFEIYDDITNKTILVKTTSLERAEEIASRWDFEDLEDGELLDVDKGLKIGDIVEYNPYPEEKDRESAYGKIKRIGTHEELNIHSMYDDSRIMYELESLEEDERYRNVFSITTGRWINKVDYNLVKSKKFRTFDITKHQ